MVFVKAKVGPPNIGDPKGLFTLKDTRKPTILMVG